MIAVYIIIGLVAGVAIGWLSGRAGTAATAGKLQGMEGELQRSRQDLESEKERSNNALSAERERGRVALDEERKRLREEADKRLEASEKLWEERLAKLKTEIENLTSESLASKQNSLQETNREQIGEMLKPIKEQFDAFRKSVEESKTSNEVSKNELKESFQNSILLFQQMQQQAVKSIREETARIGNEAANLTRALKRDTKKQGDWGEMILESLLESSGLVKDLHYFIQENVKDEEGRNLRPDVIVRFPEGRSVIIDSKVSLTAYVEAFESDEPTDKERRLKDHARSVRKHVDELVGKKYDTLVSDSIGFVLMFIPNDQSYLSALEMDRDLGTYAFSKGVVIISPSNLMIALQLSYNLWQQDARNKNIDRIVQTASELYDKVAGFSDTMEAVEKSINRLSDDFTKARKQLYEGKGNIMGRVENLKKLGLTPKKQIKGLD